MTEACILVGYGVHVYGFSLLAMHLCLVFTDPPAANNLLLAIGIMYTLTANHTWICTNRIIISSLPLTI